MAYINRQQIEDYLKINADILFKSDFEIKVFLEKLYSIPISDVVPRAEVERLTIELEAMRGAANSYKMHYEQAQAEKDNLVATYEAMMRTYAEQLFGEIEQEIKHALDSNYKARQEHIDKYSKGTSYVYDNFISLVNGKIQALRGIDDFLAELKKKHIGEKK